METLNNINEYESSISFLRVASARPEVAVADVMTNFDRISHLYHEAADQSVSLVTFPELSLTGYTIGDLVNQNQLLEKAKLSLARLSNVTHCVNSAMVVGLPLQVGNSLYNCAALLADGEIKGIVPKQNLPTYGEFYEDRWYQAWDKENTTIKINGKEVPFGSDLLFDIDGVPIGIEICEDLWVSSPPSTRLSEQGALVIVNPSASPEQIGKDDYRRALVIQQSARLITGYVYAGCDSSESTMDIVMSGHQLIAANGQMVAENEPFGDKRLIIQDIDIEHLRHDRRRQGFANRIGALIIPTVVERLQTDLRARVDKHPFLPDESLEARRRRLDRTIQIQAYGLAKRMEHTGQERVVLGLSGGLDSTLALFVACEAARILGKQPADMIRTLTMPGPASSEQTQDNAQRLAEMLNIPNQVIPINQLVNTELAAIGHDAETQDITYENIQARARTNILFNYGNQEGCLVLGTGDLSEIALGWCTYNVDHMSHYNVNATIPKTLIKHLVAHVAERYPKSIEVIQEILITQISPELVKEGSGITQSTEDLIGPYELHDFFMTYQLRWGDQPAKIAYLAKQAFADSYEPDFIDRCLRLYLERFRRNQFKRSVMPDGPKTGSIALSPRGDWRMPSDLPNDALWQS